MTVTLDSAVAASPYSTGTPISWNHPISAAGVSKGWMAVVLHVFGGNAEVTGVTINGVRANPVESIAPNSSVQCWSLPIGVQAANASIPIVITNSGALRVIYGSICFENVMQASPMYAYNPDNNLATSPNDSSGLGTGAAGALYLVACSYEGSVQPTATKLAGSGTLVNQWAGVRMSPFTAGFALYTLIDTAVAADYVQSQWTSGAGNHSLVNAVFSAAILPMATCSMAATGGGTGVLSAKQFTTGSSPATGGISAIPTYRTSYIREQLQVGSVPAERIEHYLVVRTYTTAVPNALMEPSSTTFPSSTVFPKGGNTGKVWAALYEDAVNRSGNLSVDINDELQDYLLPISNANAATIVNYGNLELRVWGTSSVSGLNIEIAEAYLRTPPSYYVQVVGSTIGHPDATGTLMVKDQISVAMAVPSSLIGYPGIGLQALTAMQAHGNMTAIASLGVQVTASMTASGSTSAQPGTGITLPVRSTLTAQSALVGTPTVSPRPIGSATATSNVTMSPATPALPASVTMNATGTIAATIRVIPPTERKVVQIYRLTATAKTKNFVGYTIAWRGCPFALQQTFDIMAAIQLVNDPDTQFAICDNALKEVLDEQPWLERVV